MKREGSAKNTIKMFYQINQNLLRCTILLHDAFVFNNLEFIDKCLSKVKEIRQSVKVLSDVEMDNDAKVYVKLLENVNGIVDCINQICANVKVKIRNRVAFSERAVLETSFLLARLQDVLRILSDIILSSRNESVFDRHNSWESGQAILSRDVILCEYILVSVSEIIRHSDEFVAMHQGRFVEGLCVASAAPLFMHVMEAIKGIAIHGRVIADKLTEDSRTYGGMDNKSPQQDI